MTRSYSMMKKLVAVCCSIFMCLFISTASSAALPPPSFKMGIIDLEKVMKQSSQFAAMNRDLEKRFKSKQQNILASHKALQEAAEKLNRNGPLMSDTDRAKLQNKIIADRANLQSAEISFRQEVNAVQGEEMRKFMAKLKNEATKLSRNENYTMIAFKQGALYVDDRLDVTDTILAMLEKR